MVETLLSAPEHQKQLTRIQKNLNSGEIAYIIASYIWNPKYNKLPQTIQVLKFDSKTDLSYQPVYSHGPGELQTYQQEMQSQIEQISDPSDKLFLLQEKQEMLKNPTSGISTDSMMFYDEIYPRIHSKHPLSG